MPLCNPARTSVFSGLQPSRTGVLDNAMDWTERVDPADTLPAVLKAAGVHVAMFGKLLHNETVLTSAQQSVMSDEFVMRTPNSGTRSQVIEDNVQHDDPFASGRYRGTDLQDDATVTSAVNFLRRAGDLDAPFFLAVGITKPHLNWWVPSRYFDLYDPAEIRTALRQSLQAGGDWLLHETQHPIPEWLMNDATEVVEPEGGEPPTGVDARLGGQRDRPHCEGGEALAEPT